MLMLGSGGGGPCGCGFCCVVAPRRLDPCALAFGLFSLFGFGGPKAKRFYCVGAFVCVCACVCWLGPSGQ